MCDLLERGVKELACAKAADGCRGGVDNCVALFGFTRADLLPQPILLVKVGSGECRVLFTYHC